MPRRGALHQPANINQAALRQRRALGQRLEGRELVGLRIDAAGPAVHEVFHESRGRELAPQRKHAPAAPDPGQQQRRARPSHAYAVHAAQRLRHLTRAGREDG